MGLTIHYSLRSRGSDVHARKLVSALHQAAHDLPFKELGEVVTLSGEQCDFNKRDRDDALRWLLVQSTESVELKTVHRSANTQSSRTWIDVSPTRVIAFTTRPGDGCESANFGFCQYPTEIVVSRYGRLKTTLPGWRWRSFCKTQYASDPRCGGVPNFLKCHLSVVAMLDQARTLACLERVYDEGHFWEKRDLQALVREIGSWNEMIAAFGGRLKDLLGDGALVAESAISRYPNFEQLEAAGQKKLPPGFEMLAKLIARVGKRMHGPVADV